MNTIRIVKSKIFCWCDKRPIRVKKSLNTKTDALKLILFQEQKVIELQQERKNRVVEEPELSTEHTVISVRHPFLGTLRRIFATMSTFGNVYDWVGSLAPYPVHFGIFSHGVEIQPHASISSHDRIVLVMKERVHPILVEPKGLAADDDAFAYADHELINVRELTNAAPVLQCVCKIENYLKLVNTTNREEVTKTLVVHRRPSSFWNVLFRQKIDASSSGLEKLALMTAVPSENFSSAAWTSVGYHLTSLA